MPLLSTTQPLPAVRPGDLVETRVGDRRRLVVGTLSVTDGRPVVVDHLGRPTSLTDAELAAARPAPPQSVRRYRLADAERRLDGLRRSLRIEVEAAGPSWERSPGSPPPAGMEQVVTSIGAFVFSKRTLPEREVLVGWRRLDERIEALEAEVEWLSLRVEPLAPGRLVPSQPEVAAMERLLEEGLLTDEEAALVRTWASFWEANPGAAHGLVQDDGSIKPRR